MTNLTMLQLLRIEEELGERAVYTGASYRLPPLNL
jgi:hypothetical protein